MEKKERKHFCFNNTILQQLFTCFDDWKTMDQLAVTKEKKKKNKSSSEARIPGLEACM